jgi:hypothetical protein
MKYLDILFEKFKESIEVKYDYEIAPYFHMTPNSFRGTTRKRRNDIKATCIMLHQKISFLPDCDKCEKCGELIPDEKQVEKVEGYFCPLCDNLLSSHDFL